MQDTLLNLIPGACSPEVHLSQYDKGRAIPFKLANGKSAYTVPEGAEIVVMATKPSGLGFVVPVTFDGDTATMTITETMSNEYGRFPAELSITSNGNRIGTANFVMNIERSPHPEGTIDGDAESLLPELTLLVERIEAAADSVDEDTQTVAEAKAEVLQAKADTLQAKADTLSARDDAVSAKDLAVSSAQTSVEASERAEELVGSVSTKADAIVKTASGEIASFTDGGNDLPMKSLKVNIVPKQSGTGDPSPSNVRPISGTDTVGIQQSGKNLLANNRPDSSTLGGITFTKNDDGTVTANGTATMNVYYYLPNVNSGENLNFPKGDYILSGCPSSGTASTYYMQIWAKNGWHSDTGNGGAFTVDDTITRSCAIAIRSGVTVNNLVFKPMVRRASDTDDAYEPYEGESKSISLGQTVYGGVLDVVSGKLTIDMVTVDLGSLSWNRNANYNIFTAWLNPTPMASTPTKDGYAVLPNYLYSPNFVLDSSKDKVCEIGRTGYFINNLIIRDTTYTDASTFRTAMSGKVGAYKTATPIAEIQLTPTEVKTLLGSNNIWSDSGTVEVEYRADTTLAYNELVAMILENIGN